MSGNVYTVEFDAVAVTTIVDFFEFDPAAERPIELVGLFIGQTTEVATNVGEDEFLRWRVIRGHTTTGTGGTQGVTPRPMNEFDAAAGFAADTVNTTIASAGTGVNLHTDVFNVRQGIAFWWPDQCGPRSAGANLLVVRLVAAPADSITFSGTAYVREV
jgi:hypothetical protein